jgi:hypothetical protein
MKVVKQLNKKEIAKVFVSSKNLLIISGASQVAALLLLRLVWTANFPRNGEDREPYLNGKAHYS